MATTYVSAVVRAKDGKESELERALAGVVDEVRAESGCIRYNLHRSEYGNVFFFYEIWESPAHLAAHAKSAAHGGHAPGHRRPGGRPLGGQHLGSGGCGGVENGNGGHATDSQPINNGL